MAVRVAFGAGELLLHATGADGSVLSVAEVWGGNEPGVSTTARLRMGAPIRQIAALPVAMESMAPATACVYTLVAARLDLDLVLLLLRTEADCGEVGRWTPRSTRLSGVVDMLHLRASCSAHVDLWAGSERCMRTLGEDERPATPLDFDFAGDAAADVAEQRAAAAGAAADAPAVSRVRNAAALLTCDDGSVWCWRWTMPALAAAAAAVPWDWQAAIVRGGRTCRLLFRYAATPADSWSEVSGRNMQLSQRMATMAEVAQTGDFGALAALPEETPVAGDAHEGRSSVDAVAGRGRRGRRRSAKALEEDDDSSTSTSTSTEEEDDEEVMASVSARPTLGVPRIRPTAPPVVQVGDGSASDSDATEVSVPATPTSLPGIGLARPRADTLALHSRARGGKSSQERDSRGLAEAAGGSDGETEVSDSRSDSQATVPASPPPTSPVPEPVAHVPAPVATHRREIRSGGVAQFLRVRWSARTVLVDGGGNICAPTRGVMRPTLLRNVPTYDGLPPFLLPPVFRVIPPPGGAAPAMAASMHLDREAAHGDTADRHAHDDSDAGAALRPTRSVHFSLPASHRPRAESAFVPVASAAAATSSSSSGDAGGHPAFAADDAVDEDADEMAAQGLGVVDGLAVDLRRVQQRIMSRIHTLTWRPDEYEVPAHRRLLRALLLDWPAGVHAPIVLLVSARQMLRFSPIEGVSPADSTPADGHGEAGGSGGSAPRYAFRLVWSLGAVPMPGTLYERLGEWESRAEHAETISTVTRVREGPAQQSAVLGDAPAALAVTGAWPTASSSSVVLSTALDELVHAATATALQSPSPQPPTRLITVATPLRLLTVDVLTSQAIVCASHGCCLLSLDHVDAAVSLLAPSRSPLPGMEAGVAIVAGADTTLADLPSLAITIRAWSSSSGKWVGTAGPIPLPPSYQPLPVSHAAATAAAWPSLFAAVAPAAAARLAASRRGLAAPSTHHDPHRPHWLQAAASSSAVYPILDSSTAAVCVGGGVHIPADLAAVAEALRSCHEAVPPLITLLPPLYHSDSDGAVLIASPSGVHAVVAGEQSARLQCVSDVGAPAVVEVERDADGTVLSMFGKRGVRGGDRGTLSCGIWSWWKTPRKRQRDPAKALVVRRWLQMPPSCSTAVPYAATLTNATVRHALAAVAPDAADDDDDSAVTSLAAHLLRLPLSAADAATPAGDGAIQDGTCADLLLVDVPCTPLVGRVQMTSPSLRPHLGCDTIAAAAALAERVSLSRYATAFTTLSRQPPLLESAVISAVARRQLLAPVSPVHREWEIDATALMQLKPRRLAALAARLPLVHALRRVHLGAAVAAHAAVPNWLSRAGVVAQRLASSAKAPPLVIRAAERLRWLARAAPRSSDAEEAAGLGIVPQLREMVRLILVADAALTMACETWDTASIVEELGALLAEPDTTRPSPSTVMLSAWLPALRPRAYARPVGAVDAFWHLLAGRYMPDDGDASDATAAAAASEEPLVGAALQSLDALELAALGLPPPASLVHSHLHRILPRSSASPQEPLQLAPYARLIAPSFLAQPTPALTAELTLSGGGAAAAGGAGSDSHAAAAPEPPATALLWDRPLSEEGLVLLPAAPLPMDGIPEAIARAVAARSVEVLPLGTVAQAAHGGGTVDAATSQDGEGGDGVSDEGAAAVVPAEPWVWPPTHRPPSLQRYGLPTVPGRARFIAGAASLIAAAHHTVLQLDEAATVAPVLASRALFPLPMLVPGLYRWDAAPAVCMGLQLVDFLAGRPLQPIAPAAGRSQLPADQRQSATPTAFTAPGAVAAATETPAPLTLLDGAWALGHTPSSSSDHASTRPVLAAATALSLAQLTLAPYIAASAQAMTLTRQRRLLAVPVLPVEVAQASWPAAYGAARMLSQGTGYPVLEAVAAMIKSTTASVEEAVAAGDTEALRALAALPLEVRHEDHIPARLIKWAPSQLQVATALELDVRQWLQRGATTLLLSRLHNRYEMDGPLNDVLPLGDSHATPNYRIITTTRAAAAAAATATAVAAPARGDATTRTVAGSKRKRGSGCMDDTAAGHGVRLGAWEQHPEATSLFIGREAVARLAAIATLREKRGTRGAAADTDESDGEDDSHSVGASSKRGSEAGGEMSLSPCHSIPETWLSAFREVTPARYALHADAVRQLALDLWSTHDEWPACGSRAIFRKKLAYKAGHAYVVMQQAMATWLRMKLGARVYDAAALMPAPPPLSMGLQESLEEAARLQTAVLSRRLPISRDFELADDASAGGGIGEVTARGKRRASAGQQVQRSVRNIVEVLQTTGTALAGSALPQAAAQPAAGHADDDRDTEMGGGHDDGRGVQQAVAGSMYAPPPQALVEQLAPLLLGALQTPHTLTQLQQGLLARYHCIVPLTQLALVVGALMRDPLLPHRAGIAMAGGQRPTRADARIIALALTPLAVWRSWTIDGMEAAPHAAASPHAPHVVVRGALPGSLKLDNPCVYAPPFSRQQVGTLLPEPLRHPVRRLQPCICVRAAEGDSTALSQAGSVTLPTPCATPLCYWYTAVAFVASSRILGPAPHLGVLPAIAQEIQGDDHRRGSVGDASTATVGDATAAAALRPAPKRRRHGTMHDTASAAGLPSREVDAPLQQPSGDGLGSGDDDDDDAAATGAPHYSWPADSALRSVTDGPRAFALLGTRLAVTLVSRNPIVRDDSAFAESLATKRLHIRRRLVSLLSDAPATTAAAANGEGGDDAAAAAVAEARLPEGRSAAIARAQLRWRTSLYTKSITVGRWWWVVRPLRHILPATAAASGGATGPVKSEAARYAALRGLSQRPRPPETSLKGAGHRLHVRRRVARELASARPVPGAGRVPETTLRFLWDEWDALAAETESVGARAAAVVRGSEGQSMPAVAARSGLVEAALGPHAWPWPWLLPRARPTVYDDGLGLLPPQDDAPDGGSTADSSSVISRDGVGSEPGSDDGHGDVDDGMLHHGREAMPRAASGGRLAAGTLGAAAAPGRSTAAHDASGGGGGEGIDPSGGDDEGADELLRMLTM